MNAFLTAADVADRLNVCRTTAAKLMQTMNCIDVSTSSARQQLRVSESDFMLWTRQRQQMTACSSETKHAENGKKRQKKKPDCESGF